MSTRFDLETALSTWRHQYKYSRVFKGRDLDELEQHIRDEVTYLVDSGRTEEDAFRISTTELGGYHETESAYRSVAFMKTRDRREVTREIAHQVSMLSSYFRVALRNLKKNRASSVINIVSLSVAIAVTLVTFLLVSAFLTEDYYHEHADEIFLVHRVEPIPDNMREQADEPTGDVRADSDWTFGLRDNRATGRTADDSRAPRYDDPAFQWYGMTPGPLGPAIAESSPDIVNSVRILHTRGQVIQNGESFGLSIRFVDESFFDVFSFPLASGTTEAVRTGDGIILGAEQAERFFGGEDPIGRTLTIQYGDDDAREVEVTGVAAPFRANADLTFDALMPIGAAEQVAGRPTSDWSTYDMATYVQLRSADAATRVEAQMAAYTEPVNSALAARAAHAGSASGQATAGTSAGAADEIQPVHSFALDNLKDLTRHREYVESSIVSHLPWAPIVVLGGLSALLLLLACFNYMNITVAQATKRLREIGVRKVIGANRAQVAFQFLAENILLCTFALLFGLLLAWSFVLPAFNGIASLNLEFALLSDWRLWIFLGALVLGTGAISGLYPALYVSSFRPTIIFRGMDRTGKRRPLTTAFQGFQFMLAFLSLAAGVTLVLNGRYYADRSAGYETDRAVVFSVGSAAEMDVLRAAADETPQVTEWTTVANSFERVWREQPVMVDGRDFEAVIFGISRAYPDMMDMRPIAGRLPGTGAGTAEFAPEHILVNRAFVNRLANLGSIEAGAPPPNAALGLPVRLDSTDYEIAGVVEDFHYEDFFSIIEPAMLRIAPESEHRYLVVNTLPGDRGAVAEQIAERYEAAFPDRIADYFLQGAMFDAFQNESDGLTAIFLFVAILALVISCLSIYALSAQNVLNRLKEVGVRKVLGGRPLGIAQRVNRKIVIVLTVAAVAAAPIGYNVLGALLDNLFAYHMDMSAMPFILAFAIIVGTTIATISIQVRAIDRARPADILGAE